MTDHTPPAAPETPQEPQDGPQGAFQASGGGLAARDGDSAPQAASGAFGWTQLEARAFNAVGPAVRDAGQWLPLSARRAVANAVLAEPKRELDALAEYENTINWQTTCTSCARIPDSSHRETVSAETAEAALARVHHVAGLIAAGAPWTSNLDNLARRIREAATVEDSPAPR